MPEKIPLMIWSDAVSAPSGLARITRDIASRVHEHMADVFDVCTIGYGGSSSSKFPWHQYAWAYSDDWIISDLPEVWYDFAGSGKGIFMTVQDPGRCLWMARPETCSDDPAVQKFLKRAPFKRWGYFPIDSTGPRNKLSTVLQACLHGYDRVLAYTKWAERIVLNSLGISACEDRQLWNLPHGIDSKVFYPRGRKFRQIFGQLAQLPRPISYAEDDFVVGIVATNQPRKDFGLGLAVCAELEKKYKQKFKIWIHTDKIDRWWSIPYLMSDFGLFGENVISGGLLDDDNMAKLYSCCDVTLGIGAGEGYGYPCFESLACGVPCVHGNYGGAPEYMPPELLVEPKAYRMEGCYASVRPVFDVQEWVWAVEKAVDLSPDKIFLHRDLRWENLWPRWESWFKKGVHEFHGDDRRDPVLGTVAGVRA